MSSVLSGANPSEARAKRLVLLILQIIMQYKDILELSFPYLGLYLKKYLIKCDTTF